jgi:tRNA (mo5U34)-methyltransferase
MEKNLERTLVEKLDSVHWYHRFEISPGITSPGTVDIDPQAYLDGLGVPADLTGKRAIDIGTWDGPMAFALEARGAQVVALDIQDPSNTGFNIARDLLNSKASYVRGSVYDVRGLVDGCFDIVLFLGVFYHLKHPILAFERLNEILTLDGSLYFEGECLLSYAEDPAGTPVREPFLRQLGDSVIPMTLCYPATYKGARNWFVPNFSCLKGWLQAAGFTLVDHGFTHHEDSQPPVQRVQGHAKKSHSPIGEHRLVQPKD